MRVSPRIYTTASVFPVKSEARATLEVRSEFWRGFTVPARVRVGSTGMGRLRRSVVSQFSPRPNFFVCQARVVNRSRLDRSRNHGGETNGQQQRQDEGSI